MKACEIALRDPNSDGLLAVLAPQGMTDPARIAEGLKSHARVHGKPILASWMGGKLVAQGTAILNQAGIPTFSYPDTAARAFSYMWRYTYNLRGIYETPSLAEEVDENNRSCAETQEFLDGIRRTGRTVLTELESKHLLNFYKLPTVETRLARSAAEAALIARSVGFPVVMKLHSETVTHKTDVGGVKLNLPNEESIVPAFREIEASVREKAGPDAFDGVTVQPMIRLDGYGAALSVLGGLAWTHSSGPVILFGSGGPAG